MPGSRKKVFLDFETYCEADLKKVGLDNYTAHPTCEVLMLAWAFEGEEAEESSIRQWVPAEGEPMPDDLKEILEDDCIVFEAWNAAFERYVFKRVLGVDIPIDRWLDTMIVSAYGSFPLTLAGASKALSLGDDKAKMASGKRLLRRFCQPRTPTKTKPWTRETVETAPEAWEEFKRYNRMDVVAEMAIARKLQRFHPPEFVWEEWRQDQRINDAGMPINLRRVRNAIRIYEEELEAIMAELRDLTGLDNPNSVPQMLEWVRERGYPFEDLQKAHVLRGIERLKEEIEKAEFKPGADVGGMRDAVKALEMRVRAGQMSVKKFYALDRCTGPDGHLRGAIQFYGAARTGRFAGRVFQPQNLPRPHWEFEEPEMQEELARCVEQLPRPAVRTFVGDVMTALKSSIRQCVEAPDGYVFCGADFSAIENRGIGWICGDEKILDVFRKNRDPYIDFATHLYGLSYEEIFHEVKVLKKKEKRTLSKPAVLGCGYMLGPGKKEVNPRTGEVEAYGLLGYAMNMGIEMTEEQAQKSVDVFRDTFKDVRRFWYESLDAVKAVIRDGVPRETGPIRFDMKGPFLRARLPSGRHLHYFRPRIEMKETPWGEQRPTVTYMGQGTHGQWQRLKTHPGKLLENFTQAICRDLLTYSLRRAEEAGLDVRLHVHDEILVLAREEDAEETQKVLLEVMSEAPPWAKDFPMAAAGGISKMFMKD